MAKPSLSFLSQGEVEAIHNDSLEVLESTGIRVMSFVKGLRQALDELPI